MFCLLSIQLLLVHILYITQSGSKYFHRSHSVIPEAAYILPNKLLPTEKTDTVSEESTSTVPGFDLGKFNECVAERRAILDHPNKNISVSILKYCLPQPSRSVLYID